MSVHFMFVCEVTVAQTKYKEKKDLMQLMKDMLKVSAFVWAV